MHEDYDSSIMTVQNSRLIVNIANLNIIFKLCNMDFKNVSLDELDKIENLLKVNIHIFGCNKKFNSKKIIRKSKSDFDKDLDLLLIDDIKHYVLIKNINKFISDNSHVIKTCRNCLNVFIQK